MPFITVCGCALGLLHDNTALHEKHCVGTRLHIGETRAGSTKRWLPGVYSSRGVPPMRGAQVAVYGDGQAAFLFLLSWQDKHDQGGSAPATSRKVNACTTFRLASRGFVALVGDR